MATTPMSQPDNPQAGAPSPSPDQAPASAQQANSLQQSLGKLALLTRQLAAQNAIIQPEMQQMSSLAIQALQKVSQASAGPAQPLSAPPAQ